MARTGAVLNDQLYSDRPSVESGLRRTLRSLVLNSGSPCRGTGTSAAQWEMDTGMSVEGSGISWSIGLILMSRPKPRKEILRLKFKDAWTFTDPSLYDTSTRKSRM
jgi:hypothetical protein